MKSIDETNHTHNFLEKKNKKIGIWRNSSMKESLFKLKKYFQQKKRLNLSFCNMKGQSFFVFQASPTK